MPCPQEIMGGAIMDKEKNKPCPECKGSGKCPKCHGTGQYAFGGVCGSCDHKGSGTCRRCHGEGKVV